MGCEAESEIVEDAKHTIMSSWDVSIDTGSPGVAEGYKEDEWQLCSCARNETHHDWECGEVKGLKRICWGQAEAEAIGITDDVDEQKRPSREPRDQRVGSTSSGTRTRTYGHSPESS